MLRKRTPFFLILLTVLVAVITGIVTGIVPAHITIKDPRLVWGLVVGVVVLGAGVAYWQYRYEVGAAGAESVDKSQARRNRQAVLKKIHKDWIEGLLEQSLYQVARIDLGLKTSPDAVTSPWNLAVHRPDQKPCLLPYGTRIKTVFEDAGKALAVLGEPGCGKTTLLLELARDLLDQTQNDPELTIPVVFNLSSWAIHRAPLEAWLVDELSQRYYVPEKVAQAWVEADQIALLLDGLDEVATKHRLACLEAINAFHQRHGAAPLAVCCRTVEYENLPVRLNLREAIVIQPLTREQVDDYLAQAGEELAGMRAVLQTDEELGELLRTPLMLWVASLAYRGRSAHEVHSTGSLEDRRRELFSRYVEAMFERPGRAKSQGKAAPYTKQQTIEWLSWLASAMRQHSQTMLFLEEIQADWLSSRKQQWGMRAGAAILIMLIGGLIGGLAGGLLFLPVIGLHEELSGGLVFGLILGLFCVFGLALGVGLGGCRRINPVETLSISWEKTKGWLILGLLIGLGSGLIAWLREDLVLVLLAGPFIGLVSLVVGLEEGQIAIRTVPNEGMRRSARNAMLILLGVGLGGGLVSWLFFWPVVRLVACLFVGLYVGLGVGLMKGGIAFLQHLSLRFVLWMKGYAPLRYVRFLNYATKLIFLRQVGGGYVFVHRMLLEHFASLEPKT